MTIIGKLFAPRIQSLCLMNIPFVRQSEPLNMKIDTVTSENMKKFIILMHIAIRDFYELDNHDLSTSSGTTYLQHHSMQWLNYLVRAENRYIKYLTLLQKSIPVVVPVPPTDVLLMWLMHLLIDFNSYFEDMFRLFGPTFVLDAIIPINQILQNWSLGNDYTDSESVDQWEQYTSEPYKLQGWNSSNIILSCPNCEVDCHVKTAEFISFRLGRFISNIVDRCPSPFRPSDSKGGSCDSPLAGMTSVDDVPAIKCSYCNFVFTKEAISAKRFVDDLTACMTKQDRFVSGTILDPFTGTLDPTRAKELIYMLFDFKEENINILFSKIFKNDPWSNIQHQLWRLENLFFVRSDLETFQKYNSVMRHIVKAMPERYSSISPLSCDLIQLWSTFKYFYELIYKRFPMLGNLLHKDLSTDTRNKLLYSLDFGINVGFPLDREPSEPSSPLGKSFRSSLVFAKESFEKSFRHSFFKESRKPPRDSSFNNNHKLKALNIVMPLDLESLPPSPVSSHPPLVIGKEIDFDEILMRYNQYLDLIFHPNAAEIEKEENVAMAQRMQYIPDVDIIVAFFTHILDTEHYLEYICGSFMTANSIWSLSLKMPFEDIKRNVFLTEKAWKERYGDSMIVDWQIWR